MSSGAVTASLAASPAALRSAVASRVPLSRASALRQAHRPRADAAGGERRRSLAVPSRREHDDRADGGDGVVAVAARELVEGVAGALRQDGEMRLDDHLARPARGGHVELEEIVRRDLAPAVRSFGDHAAAEEEKHHRHLGRRVGMAEAADDGAAVADRDVGDMRHGLADQRIGLRAPPRSARARDAASSP